MKSCCHLCTGKQFKTGFSVNHHIAHANDVIRTQAIFILDWNFQKLNHIVKTAMLITRKVNNRSISSVNQMSNTCDYINHISLC